MDARSRHLQVSGMCPRLTWGKGARATLEKLSSGLDGIYGDELTCARTPGLASAPNRRSGNWPVQPK